MTHCRNLLLHGLSLLLRRIGAVVWLFVFSLGIAVLFSVRLHSQFAGLLDHSLAAESLTNGFDLGTAVSVLSRLGDNMPGNLTSTAGIPVFLLLYFVLTPGVLFCYLTNERARLSTLLRQGLLHFWRFVRITIVAAIAFGLVLGPLAALNKVWASFIEDHVLGRPGFLLRLAGTLVVFLVASLLRLYFDLVEVYTVQLGLALRPNGKVDRRTRRTYGPALRALRLHLLRAWGGFLLLSLIGFVGYLFLSRTALHTLAQPRVWPLLLFSQLAVLYGIAVRLWQRGAEVTLAQDHPFLAVVEVPARPAFVPVSSAPAYAAPVAPVVPLSAAPVLPSAAYEPPPVTAAVASAAAPTTGREIGGAQAIAPPSELSEDPAVPLATVPVEHTPASLEDRPAPARAAYDIDPFTPLPPPPNPLPAEVEEDLPDRERDRRPGE